MEPLRIQVRVATDDPLYAVIAAVPTRYRSDTLKALARVGVAVGDGGQAMAALTAAVVALTHAVQEPTPRVVPLASSPELPPMGSDRVNFDEDNDAFADALLDQLGYPF